MQGAVHTTADLLSVWLPRQGRPSSLKTLEFFIIVYMATHVLHIGIFESFMLNFLWKGGKRASRSPEGK